jgi:hypothetical protein
VQQTGCSEGGHQGTRDDLQTPDLPINNAATIAATLAETYAQPGDIKTALQKYHYHTDTHGYQANNDVKKVLAHELVRHGDTAERLALIADPKQLVYTVIALHDAAVTTGNRLNLVDANTSLPIHNNLKEIGE